MVTSEIFPLKVRGRSQHNYVLATNGHETAAYIHSYSGIAVSLTTSANWIGNFIIAMVTPLMLGSILGTAGTFYILGCLLLVTLLFVLFTLPETKVGLEAVTVLVIL